METLKVELADLLEMDNGGELDKAVKEAMADTLEAGQRLSLWGVVEMYEAEVEKLETAYLEVFAQELADEADDGAVPSIELVASADSSVGDELEAMAEKALEDWQRGLIRDHLDEMRPVLG